MFVPHAFLVLDGGFIWVVSENFMVFLLEDFTVVRYDGLQVHPTTRKHQTTTVFLGQVLQVQNLLNSPGCRSFVSFKRSMVQGPGAVR